MTDDTGYSTLAETTIDHGHYSLSLLIGGVHCAGCIQKIESTLLQNPHIKTARLNFSTGRLLLLWNGAPELADAYVHMIENLGYTVMPYTADIEREESTKQDRFLLLCLGVAGFSMGNIMLLSVGVWATSAETMGMATRDFMHWISALIAIPTILFSGRPFFRSALKALKSGHTNMDVPISLALILASGMSLLETFHHGEHVYFDSAIMLMFFLLIGRYLDFRARRNARSSATDLLSTLSGFATVIDGVQSRKLPIRALRADMIVRVAAGEKFPVDGIVIEGNSEVDTSLVTGETMPRTIGNGHDVFAGTMNISAPVTITVAKAAEDSLLADIVRLMEKAGQGQARYVRLADKAAQLYTPIVHSSAALAFLGWWLIGGMEWQNALMIAITVLIITCPCALGLAVPVVQVLATGRLMKNGVLVKSGDALERLAGVDTMLIDKTGTLTQGHPELSGQHDEDKLKLAASLAAHSTHPLSKALHAAYNGALLNISDVQEHVGLGMEGLYHDKSVRLGSRNWCGDKMVPPSENLELWLAVDGQPPYAFHLNDQPRKDAAQTMALFKASGIKAIMISGDRQNIADHIARECGIDDVYAEQSPTDKFTIMEELKAKGHKVLMVGDGLNDAPVLAGADISIAPGTAIDMTQNAADIIFMGENLSSIYEVYNTSKRVQSLVKENFALAILYNIIAVPLALGGFVTPMIAAIAMSGSSLIVIANSFRLRF